MSFCRFAGTNALRVFSEHLVMYFPKKKSEGKTVRTDWEPMLGPPSRQLEATAA